jgi:hypothetical protein
MSLICQCRQFGDENAGIGSPRSPLVTAADKQEARAPDPPPPERIGKRARGGAGEIDAEVPAL